MLEVPKAYRGRVACEAEAGILEKYSSALVSLAWAETGLTVVALK